ncbi:hypothetical protein SEA_KINGBOB_55 [Arthrobacter phage KingBob]|uniref:Uncharacterized protein n=1 Tax=Arthrobacter phage Sergei TaxID=2250416 RepID=A0A345KPZ3_9CAUD|nr:hypothetical protein KDJ06_gp55 [Arthrobacter phage Sergei]ASZ74369.1 hypothetical protein TEMPER16_55 [Arthrobacter phage Temper16]AXH43982.1 hypothetical protein SEA_DAIBOJU_55 [Arthrobacter phage Daiboju]AXH44044.1 hypothetical protein SEA_HERB_55 [Arthrobacter phage Herb]AXH44288.1 hypothetical protein SEA_KINGBOB_55 [Arthrobacter phage KingBob]QGJ97195.1 hypothetical protein SEA_MARIA1952_54 [Arthrobacter phage Maria1952]
MEDPRIEKLPRWARDKLRWLQQDLDEARTERDKLRSKQLGEPESPVYINNYREGVDTMLPKYGTVVFRVGPHERDVIRARINHNTGRLDLNGERQLMVLPVASNAAEVTLGDA